MTMGEITDFQTKCKRKVLGSETSFLFLFPSKMGNLTESPFYVQPRYVVKTSLSGNKMENRRFLYLFVVSCDPFLFMFQIQTGFCTQFTSKYLQLEKIYVHGASLSIFVSILSQIYLKKRVHLRELGKTRE